MTMDKQKHPLGRETNRQPLNNLGRDAAIATAAGMSYGKLKAMQYEEIRQGKRPMPQVGNKPPAHGRKTFALTCVQCGVQYFGGSQHRKYCSEECKNRADSAKYRERQKAKKEEQRNG